MPEENEAQDLTGAPQPVTPEENEAQDLTGALTPRTRQRLAQTVNDGLTEATRAYIRGEYDWQIYLDWAAEETTAAAAEYAEFSLLHLVRRNLVRFLHQLV